MQRSGGGAVFGDINVNARRPLIPDVICTSNMRILGYISIMLGIGVFAFAIVGGTFALVETTILLLLGFIALAVDRIQDSQARILEAIEQHRKNSMDLQVAIDTLSKEMPAAPLERRSAVLTDDLVSEILDANE